MLWRYGSEIIKDPARARELLEQGWVVECINDSDNQDAEEEHSPCRPGGMVTMWRFGHSIIEDPHAAQRLREEGWLLEAIDNDRHSRGRSPRKRRCVATEHDLEDNGSEQSQDDVHVMKKQRRYSSPDGTSTDL